MNKINIPEHDLDNFLKQTFKDDLPPETEARMKRHFLNLKRSLDQPGEPAELETRWLWARGIFRKEVLAFASVVMLILGCTLHLTGDHSALANTIFQFKLIVDVSTGLYSVTSMDCTVKIQGAGDENSDYRVRWSAAGITRVDLDSVDGTDQTLWISNTTLLPDPVWQPAMEFLTPAMLAQHMGERYGLMQNERRDGAEQDELLLVGREGPQVIEISVDAGTYLPKTLKKYLQGSGGTGEQRQCVVEIRFQWNQPIPLEILNPGSHSAN